MEIVLILKSIYFSAALNSLLISDYKINYYKYNNQDLNTYVYISENKSAKSLKGGDKIMYPYKLPELTYSYDSLEPYIDKETMEIHYTKHHGAYVNNLNAALEKYPYLHSFCLTDLLANLRALPDDIREAVRNNGGGHLNHSLWWEILKPGGSNVPVGELANEIEKTWGSFEKFKEEFNKAAMSRFGSGWAFLVLDRFQKLHIISYPNQDSPYLEGFIPLMGIDVWEHSYYLKYQNRRADYLNAVWNVLNWNVIEQNYQKAKDKVKQLAKT
jgi:Fe-Mn family superoxide dismutase